MNYKTAPRATPKAVAQALAVLRLIAAPTEFERAEARMTRAKKQWTDAARQREKRVESVPPQELELT